MADLEKDIIIPVTNIEILSPEEPSSIMAGINGAQASTVVEQVHDCLKNFPQLILFLKIVI